jgi:hypothetical protein
MKEMSISEMFRGLAREAKKAGNHKLVMIHFRNFRNQRKKARLSDTQRA